MGRFFVKQKLSQPQLINFTFSNNNYKKMRNTIIYDESINNKQIIENCIINVSCVHAVKRIKPSLIRDIL